VPWLGPPSCTARQRGLPRYCDLGSLLFGSVRILKSMHGSFCHLLGCPCSGHPPAQRGYLARYSSKVSTSVHCAPLGQEVLNSAVGKLCLLLWCRGNKLNASTLCCIIRHHLDQINEKLTVEYKITMVMHAGESKSCVICAGAPGCSCNLSY